MKQKKSDFYTKYGFDIGDQILLLPDYGGRSLSEEERTDILSRAQLATVYNAISPYYEMSRDIVSGPYYKTIFIEPTNGERFCCSPEFYRITLIKDPTTKPSIRKKLKGHKLIKNNSELLKRLKIK